MRPSLSPSGGAHLFRLGGTRAGPRKLQIEFATFAAPKACGPLSPLPEAPISSALEGLAPGRESCKLNLRRLLLRRHAALSLPFRRRPSLPPWRDSRRAAKVAN